jgi:uncharacterized protein (TIGR03435 family)
MRRLVMTAVCAALAATVRAQSPAPGFEAISIKAGTGTRIAAHWEGARYVAAGIPLRTLLAIAYGVPFAELTGLPSWVASDPWEINAAATREPSAAEQDLFVRALLEQRFGVRAHVATEERPIYALTSLGSGTGPRKGLTRSAVDCVGGLGSTAALNEGLCRIENSAAAGVYARKGAPIESLTLALRAFLQRPVVDRTGMTGLYDFDLHFRPLTTGPVPSEADGLPDLQTAVQEQLGLKLEPGRGPVTFTVFDRIERPTPN